MADQEIRRRSVTCTEPDGRPEKVRIEIGEDGRFQVFAVEPVGKLRRTVLRKGTEGGPDGSRLLLSLEVRGQGGASQMFVGKANDLQGVRQPGVNPERVLRANEQVQEGGPLVTDWAGELRFALDISEDQRRGAAHAATDATVGSPTGDGTAPLYWVVPTAWETARAPLTRGLSELVARLRKAGVSPMLLSLLLLGGMALGVVLWAAWQERAGRMSAEAQMEEMTAGRDAALAGEAAALAGEEACVTARVDLAERLGDDSAEKAARIDRALALDSSRARSIAMRIPLGEEALKQDQVQRRALVGAGVAAYDLLGEGTTRSERCAKQEAALGGDLPRYVLYWHPDPNQVCPEKYEKLEDTVRLVGAWGLSDRVLRDAGGEGTEEGEDDPRRGDRWSAQHLAQGIREVREGIFAARTGGRPVVAASLVDFWALVLWDGVNRMPRGAPGVDRSARECVAAAIEGRVARSSTAATGEPVLPDPSLPMPGWEPTPEIGCPWPADTVAKGVEVAIKAVARAAQ